MPLCSPDEDDPNSMTRFPLTPIPVDGQHRIDDDAKSTTSASFSRSHSDDELRPSLYQRRKSSVTGLALARPPYHRRRSHNRRASPARNSPGLPASLTPIHANFNAVRRTSLPALHFHETVRNVVPIRIETRTTSRTDSISDDMYGRLDTFTFGAPPRVEQNSDESDEEERKRGDRSKMRAIDDGTRRPSLPTNSSTPVAPRPQTSLSSMSVASSAGIVVGERQWDEHDEPDWDIVMGDTTPTKASPPPPPTPSTIGSTNSESDPRRPSLPIAVPGLRRRSRSADDLITDFDMRARTPTPLSTSTPQLYSWDDNHNRDDSRGTSSSPEENAAYDGFDLNFIYSDAEAAEAAAADPHLHRQTSAGRLRNRFRRQAANAQPARIEDTFAAHVQEYDSLYHHRRREWSFRREVRPTHHASSPKGKDKDRTAKDKDEPQEGWRCEWIGRFMVIKMRSEKPPPPGIDAPKEPYNRLQIVHASDPQNKGNTVGGPRVLVHRHSRARAFSIFRGHMLPKKIMVPTDSILLAVKSVLREYTRTESTRALKTHGLTDDGDARPPHQHQPHHHHQHHHQSRPGSGTHGVRSQLPQSSSERPRSKSTSRANGSIMHEASSSSMSEVKRSSAPESSRPAKHSISPPQSQPPETRSRKDSTRTVVTSSPSGSRSTSTSRPSSLALSRSQTNTSTSSVEHIPPVPRRTSPTPASPRTSTSHAEAFAMRDLDLDSHHHRDDSGSVHAHLGVPLPPPHAAPLPPPATPSPPHGQRSGFGFGERIKRAFGSTKPQPQPQPKEQKEPVSPSTEEEEEPKTANQEGKFAPPWLTVVRRTEREQHDRMIRTLNDSFESVGLIPPQDKKKPSKPRSSKGSKGEECPVFEEVPDDSMCMLLPLWPGETEPEPEPPAQGLSRHSTRSRTVSTRHGPTPSVVPTTTNIPLQERKFLLVYYVPFALGSPTDAIANGGSNNKKRRRPQTAGERPQHHHHHVKASAPGSFHVVARLLGYDDVRSSGVRLPEKGLAVTGPLDEAARTAPSYPNPGGDAQENSVVIALCNSPEDGVELVQEGLEKLGLRDPTVPRTRDVNGDPGSVRLSAVGQAIIEMVWSGCVSLMSFEA